LAFFSPKGTLKRAFGHAFGRDATAWYYFIKIHLHEFVFFKAKPI